jgi:ubiquinone/menaquinone biosynthesis C-methylase UbiE
MDSVKDPEGAEARALAEVIDFSGRRVLEIGCGDGRMTWLFAPQAREVLGIDPDEELIADARAATPPELAERVSFLVAEAAELEIPPAKFDIAFLSWSL